MKLRHVAGVALFLVGGAAQSASFVGDVDALANSSTGGVGRSTGIVLNPGDSFSILAAPTDLWNAGPLPRWSNADGLLGNLFATGTDDSLQAPGVQIGQAFVPWTQNGLTAPFGELVGSFDSGTTFFKVGTSYSAVFSGVSPATLKLYYWDENNFDNTGSVQVSVQSIPEPGTYAMFFAGLGVMGFLASRRRRQ